MHPVILTAIAKVIRHSKYLPQDDANTSTFVICKSQTQSQFKDNPKSTQSQPKVNPKSPKVNPKSTQSDLKPLSGLWVGLG